MKYFLIFTLFLLTFIGKTLIDANFFATLEPNNDFDCQAIYHVSGPEDMDFLGDKILISGTNLFPQKLKQGTLYIFDPATNKLTDLKEQIKISLYPHGIDIYGNKIFVISHHPKGDRIEVFNYLDSKLTHLRTITDELFFNLNDVVAIDDQRFIATSDHFFQNELIKKLENYLRPNFSFSIYFDGKKSTKLDTSMNFSNGIEYHQKTQRFFIANMLEKEIKIFKFINNKFTNTEKIKLNFFPDNLNLQSDQNTLHITGHSKILKLKKHSENPNSVHSPSSIYQYDILNRTLNPILIDGGENISASSSSLFVNKTLYIGNIYLNHFHACKKKKNEK